MVPRVALWIVLFSACALSLQAQEGDWPSWRGDGNGVSAEVDLPVEWGEESGIVWKARIEGQGHSSPIVWGDRVFLTAAHERSDVIFTKSTLNWGVGAISLVIIAALVVVAVPRLRRREAGQERIRGPGWVRFVAGVESIGVVLLSGYFFWRLRDLLLVGSLKFTPEHPDVTWILTGEVAALGLIAAVGFLRLESRGRLAGAVALLVAEAAFHLLQPRGLANLAVPTSWQRNVLLPVAVAAGWFLLMWAVAKLVGFRESRSDRPWILVLRPIGLVAVATLVFAYFNYVEAQVGLVRSVIALNRDTGKVVWEKGSPAPAGRKYPTNSYATPTPTTNGRYVVASFGSFMVSLDFDGNVAWTRKEPLFSSYLRHGAGASPVIYGDRVLYAFLPEIQEAGTENPDWSFEVTSYLTALDVASGEELWRVEPIPGGHDTFGTPLLVPTPEGMAVLLSVFSQAHAYSVESGEHLWTFQIPLSVPVPSLVSNGRAVYMSGGLFGPTVVAAISLEGTNSINRLAVRKRLQEKGPRTLWKTIKGTPEVASPIAYEGLVYWVTQNGRMFCAEAETGDIVWKERLNSPVNASPVAGDGKLYIASTDGTVHVLQAGREFKLLASNQLDEPIFASPAIAGGRIFIRGARHLYAIGGM